MQVAEIRHVWPPENIGHLLVTRRELALQRRIPDGGVAPVGVPAREQEWVAASAERMSRGLSRAGYPVVGDLADLVPRHASYVTGAGGAEDRQVLDLAIRMVVDPGWRSPQGPEILAERRVEQ